MFSISSLPDDEHKMFETSRRKEEKNPNINLKSAFCLVNLLKPTCHVMHQQV